MLKLYGSTTSPFVRRLRMWLASTEHEFVDLDIFSPEARAALAVDNPTLKIPMVEDNGQLLFDSRVIFRYLSEKQGAGKLSWEQENYMTLVDAATDSLVQLLILSRSGIDTEDDKMYFKVQRERIGLIFEKLDDLVASGEFEQWDYPAICLYTLVDWVVFRDLHDITGFSNLLAFEANHKNRIEVTATDPRN